MMTAYSLEECRKSVEADPKYITTANEDGFYPLHHASLNGDVELGTFLISHGADVNVIDHNGNTPLHNCSYHNSPKFATLLIKEGANVNIQTKNLETPLDYATENGHTDMIRVLIDAGAEVSRSGENGWTPLHSASQQTRRHAIDIVKLLLAAGANPVARTNSGEQPSQVAATPQIKALLVEAEKHAVLRESLKEPEQIHGADQLGRTPLHRAVLADDLPLCRALLQAGAKVTAQDTHGNSPIHNASYHNSIAALELLLAQSDAVGALLLRTSEGDSALDYACGNNHLTAAEALLRAGAMVNDADSRRWTALHNACATYHPNALPLINALLEAGADPTLTNSDGMRPIDLTQDNPIRAVLKRRIDAILADEEFLDGGVEF